MMLRASQSAAIAVQFFAFPLLSAAALSNTKPLPFRPTARLSLPSHCSTTLYPAFSGQSASVHTIASASLFFSGAVQTISLPLLSCPVHCHSNSTRYIFLSTQCNALFFRRYDIQCKPAALPCLSQLSVTSPCPFCAVQFISPACSIPCSFRALAPGSWPSADGTRYRLLCLPSASGRAPVPRPAS